MKDPAYVGPHLSRVQLTDAGTRGYALCIFVVAWVWKCQLPGSAVVGYGRTQKDAYDDWDACRKHRVIRKEVELP